MLHVQAQVYAFPERHGGGNRLTVRDKIHLHGAAERIVAAGLQCVIGRDQGGSGGPGPLSHDFLQLLRTADASTAWTIVRSGPEVRVWHGTAGRDLGSFASVADALDAALESSSND